MDQYQRGDFHTMVLSAESFFGGPPLWRDLESLEEYEDCQRRKLDLLRALIDGRPTKVVVYLRRQDRWLESTIQQVIRRAPLRYESDRQLMDLLLPVMDYEGRLSRWEDIVRPAELEVIAYDRRSFPAGDVAADFVTRLGLDGEVMIAAEPGKPLNPGWSREFVEVRKTLNQNGSSRLEINTIDQLITRLDREMGSGAPYRLDPQLKREILEGVEAGNRLLTQRYGGPDNVFFDDEANEGASIEVGPDDVERARRAFEKRYRSVGGRALLLKHVLAGKLRAADPALYLRLAAGWGRFREARRQRRRRYPFGFQVTLGPKKSHRPRST